MNSERSAPEVAKDNGLKETGVCVALLHRFMFCITHMARFNMCAKGRLRDSVMSHPSNRSHKVSQDGLSHISDDS